LGTGALADIKLEKYQLNTPSYRSHGKRRFTLRSFLKRRLKYHFLIQGSESVIFHSGTGEKTNKIPGSTIKGASFMPITGRGPRSSSALQNA